MDVLMKKLTDWERSSGKNAGSAASPILVPYPTLLCVTGMDVYIIGKDLNGSVFE